MLPLLGSMTPKTSWLMPAGSPAVSSNCRVTLLTEDGMAADLPSSEDCESLDARHHQKWSEAIAAHQEANRQLIEHRVQSLEISHRGRRAAVQDQIARATDEKIRRMEESELARADVDYSRRMDSLVRAANSGDIRATAIIFGTITIIGTANA
jgi:hypothetical protein